MLLLFYQRKSYRHPALRDHAEACVVYDDWPILVAKVQKIFETKSFLPKKSFNGKRKSLLLVKLLSCSDIFAINKAPSGSTSTKCLL